MIGFISITVMYFYLYAYFWFANVQLFSSLVVEDLHTDKYFLKVNDTASVYAIGPKHLWYGNESDHIFPRSLNFTAFLKFIETAIEEDKNLYVVDFHSRQVIRSDTARRFFTSEENVAIFRETVHDKDRFEDFLQTTLSNSSTGKSKGILPNLAEANGDALPVDEQRRQVNEESNIQRDDGHSSDADVAKDEHANVSSARSGPGMEGDDDLKQHQFAASNFSATSDKAEIGNASKLNETLSDLSKIVENAESGVDRNMVKVDSQLKNHPVEDVKSVDMKLTKNLQKSTVDNLQLPSGDDAVNGDNEFPREDSWISQTCDKEEEQCDETNRRPVVGVPEMPASTDLMTLLIRGVKLYFDQSRRAFASIWSLLFAVDDSSGETFLPKATTFGWNDSSLLILTCVSLMVFVVDRLLWKRWQRKVYANDSDYVRLFSKYERLVEKLEQADDLQEEKSRILAELKCKDAALKGVEAELVRASRELENARGGVGSEFLEEGRLEAMEAAIAEKDRQLQDADRRFVELREEADKLDRGHEAERQQLNEQIRQLYANLEWEKSRNEKLVEELQSREVELASTVELKQREGQLLAELEASKVEIHGLKEVVQRLWQCRRRSNDQLKGVADWNVEEDEEATGVCEGSEQPTDDVDVGLDLAKLYAQLGRSNGELEKMRAEVEKEQRCRLAVEAELEQLRCERDSMKNAQQQAEMQTMEAVTRLKVLEEFFEARQKEMQKQLGMQMVISKQLEVGTGPAGSLVGQQKARSTIGRFASGKQALAGSACPSGPTGRFGCVVGNDQSVDGCRSGRRVVGRGAAAGFVTFGITSRIATARHTAAVDATAAGFAVAGCGPLRRRWRQRLAAALRVRNGSTERRLSEVEVDQQGRNRRLRIPVSGSADKDVVVVEGQYPKWPLLRRQRPRPTVPLIIFAACLGQVPPAQGHRVEQRQILYNIAKNTVEIMTSTKTVYVPYMIIVNKNKNVTTNLSVIFKKPRLCPTYGFRVAAVNYLGMSNFSDVVEISHLSYSITDKRAFDEPYVNIEGEESARTVVVTVEYKSPPNWHLSDIVGVKSSLFWVDCRIPTNKILLVDQVTPAQNDSKIFIFLPDFVMTHMCKFMFMLEKLESACQTVFQYPDKNTSDYPGLDFILDCDNVVNSGCKNPASVINPKCFVDGVSYELVNQDEKLSKSDINITWRLSLEQLQWPILYYAIRLDEVEPDSSQFTLIYSPKVLRAVALVRTCDDEIDGIPLNCDNSTNNYLVKNIELGTRYTLQVCAVYESEQVAPIHWNLTTRTELDFTFAAVKSSNVVLKREHVYVLVASVATLLFAMLAIVLLYRRRSMKKQKSLAELANNHHDRPCATSENPYVAQPRRFDHWELGRSKVEIDFDKRLGSGAFGAVYKGKIIGRILGNRLSNSVLAENWTKMEDCDVAIKMLPEYADESAKSDFRKEINLMKQVGYHEKLVNMLGCITAEEPLCLIVEYCAQGDLLHYLRDRRKYMVQLESKGIDIGNLEDNSDVDLDMVLCLKDLISFSWQASVGMEYLSQKGFLHRDVAARNILVDHDKRIKVYLFSVYFAGIFFIIARIEIQIGDFGLCRYIYSDMVYMGKGGRLPIKWMALEAIKNYEFTTKSDVWSFGVLLFEIITLGGSPYPGIQPADMEQLLESGKRMEQPSNCPDELYMTMVNCWQKEPSTRPSFTEIRERLRAMLEKITEDYGYMGLSENRDYYNVTNAEDTGSNIS
ncbi:putative protein kinase domain protein [Trichinella spiralis]|uniref:putative protein kinase domain protein n=1 Tax=Trichinella spiralis TaxID=6334 RepID=UPI0001EFBA29|nr:putative protein kinase domain protein [Trichinella spiralis]